MTAKNFLKAAALGILYFGTGWLGLKIDAAGGFAALVWPPTGIALVFLLRFGTSLWPAVFIAASLLNYSIGAPAASSLLIGVGNTLNILAGVALLRRVGFRPSLRRLRDFGALFGLGGFVAALISATIGTFALWAAGTLLWNEVAETWMAWWWGDVMGVLLVAPMLLLWPTIRIGSFPWKKALEGVSLLVVLTIVTLGVSGYFPLLSSSDYSFPYLLFPVQIWSALRFGPFGAALTVPVSSALAIFSTVNGFGPFARITPHENLFFLQIFVAVLAHTTMFLAVAIQGRAKAEDELRASESRFRMLSDTAPVMIWTSGIDKRCNYFNRPWLDFTGRTLDQEVGDGWAEGIHSEDLDASYAIYSASFDTRKEFNMEYRLRRFDGVFRWIYDRGTPQFTPGGSFLGFVGCAIDITDRKMAEAELKKALSLRDEFLSITSHELRTPLTGMHLQVQIFERLLARLATENVVFDEVRGILGGFRQQLIKFSQLIDNILDVSRFHDGRVKFDFEEIDLTNLVKEVVKRSETDIERSRSPLDLKIEGDAVGFWDRLRMEQIFSNLLSNALKYGNHKPIEVRVGSEGTSAYLIVRDHGIGISKEDQERIFERFERAAPARNYGGLGLGLWIARQSVNAFGGRILVTSVPGEGTEFQVILPLQNERVAAA